MSEELLYDQPEWLLLLAAVGMLLASSEVGYRFGRRQRPSRPDSVIGLVGGIQGALIGLFALLLGFTFAMALERFDARTETVVKESNAIGTALLRVRLLPAAERPEVTELFRRYIDTRLRAAERPNLPSEARTRLDDDAARLQDRLWEVAGAALEADPHSISGGLFAQSINELIDAKSERDATLANHVPESVLLLLFGFAVVTSAVVGYGNGLIGVRALEMLAVFSVLIGFVILLILDLDRPGRGLIRISQDSMFQLQKSVGPPKAPR